MSNHNESTNRYARMLEAYEAIHRSPANRALHAIGIPTIMISLIGLASLVGGPGHANGGAALALVTTGVTLAWSWRAALAYTPLAGLCYAVALALGGDAGTASSGLGYAAAFAGGWIVQFAGHAFEGEAPEFTQRPENLLLGPISVTLEVLPFLRPAPAR